MLPAWEDIAANGITVQQCYDKAQKLYKQEKSAAAAAADYINTHLPLNKQNVINQADEYMKGMHILCGSGGKPCFVGNPPLWEADPFNHPEYTFMLNRMEHWPVLLHAYYLTKNAAYAEKVVSELENWIDTCPPLELAFEYAVAKPRFSARTPWRSLELGIRANRSWNIALALLIGESCFSLQLYEKMMKSFYQQAQVLYRVCPVLWPNADHNHYLTECMGLLEISCICDFMAEAGQWQQHAVKELQRCAQNQITQNGGQIEGAPHYHNECLFQMTYSIRLARRYNVSFSDNYYSLIKSMFKRSVYTTRPDGIQVPWGDSDAIALVFDAAFCHYEAFSDESVLLHTKQIFGEKGLLKAFEKHIWKLDSPQTAIDIISSKNAESLPYELFYHDAPMKQVCMRTSWDYNASSVFFSVRSPIHNDHAHIDPCGFDYYAAGKAILPDTGRYTYKEGGDRYYYKSSAAHNTLTVNGSDAFSYDGTWAYGPQKEGRVLAAGQEKDFSYIIASHDSYEPAIHTRALILTKDFLLVYDNVKGQSKTDFITAYYQCNTENAVLKDNTVCFDGNYIAFTGCEYSTLLHGKISRETDIQQSARRLCLSAQGESVNMAAVIAHGENIVQQLEFNNGVITFKCVTNQKFIVDLLKNTVTRG